VGKVGVHFADVSEVPRQGVPKAAQIRGAKAQLATALDQVYALGGLFHLRLYDGGGPVRGIVVHDKDGNRHGLGQHEIDHLANIVGLIVGGDNNQRVGGGIPGGGIGHR
jgi:hypothetical protein